MLGRLQAPTRGFLPVVKALPHSLELSVLPCVDDRSNE